MLELATLQYIGQFLQQRTDQSYFGETFASRIFNLIVSGDLRFIPSLHITFVCATPPTGLSAKTDFLGNAQSGQISFEVVFLLLRLEKIIF